MLPIFLLVPLLLVVFWAWILRDMLLNNDIPSSAPMIFQWPPEAKNQWILLFVILNVLAAIYYYSTEHKKRR